MHEDPQVPNFGAARPRARARAGHGLRARADDGGGTPEIVQGEDGWAVYSADDSLTAHFEFTVAVTEDGPRILTPWHE